ncbi:MAG: hypothetical protein RMJ43_13450 [Chloroherpetonaceae bacterium]|nr:hypothetical protein [Chthonomonadaceae bacterium]MDW8208834.1 hypothetical protein [Chloroherpetonaceae bacterium]
MKQRNAIQLVLSFAVAVMLIVCGTAFETRYSADPEVWLQAHRRSPMLWLIDFTALYTLVLMLTIAGARRRLYRLAEELHVLRNEHHNQLASTVARAAEMDALIEQQAERIEQLEQEARTRQEAFEAEAQRLVAQLFQSLQEQVAAHSRQLEAVNMALQYQRAEISELRHQVRGVLTGSSVSPAAHLSAAEMSALNNPLTPIASLPASNGVEPVATQQEPPAHDTVAVVGGHRETESQENVRPVTSPTTPDSVAPHIAEPVLRDRLTDNETAMFDPTVNAHSTYVLGTAEFNVLQGDS